MKRVFLTSVCAGLLAAAFAIPSFASDQAKQVPVVSKTDVFANCMKNQALSIALIAKDAGLTYTSTDVANTTGQKSFSDNLTYAVNSTTKFALPAVKINVASQVASDRMLGSNFDFTPVTGALRTG
jgi:hypothetical protein